MTTPWTLVLIVIAMNGTKEHAVTVTGYASEKACLSAAVTLGTEALRWRMNIQSFDCLPGNA